jgi:hypothetical protein
MPHQHDPEHPDSPASTFAPFQPGAGVVAQDVVDKGAGQTEAEFTPPKDVTFSKDENQPDARELAKEGKTKDGEDLAAEGKSAPAEGGSAADKGGPKAADKK